MPKFPPDFVPATPRPDRGTLTRSEIVALAWDDQASFDAIEAQTGLSEDEVIKIMRAEMKPSSFRMWRKRVSGRASKHKAKRGSD
ncbi:MAG: TIGR03643 family protein [Pseudomonadota bacterium]